MPFQPRRVARRARRLAARLLACSLAACGGQGAPPEPTVAPTLIPGGDAASQAACAVGPTTDGMAPEPRAIALGLPGPVDPAHAPVPRTPAERLVFAQLYATLLWIDCAGAPHAWLAETWTRGEGGRAWTFRLRNDLRDWLDRPIDAAAIAESWGRARPAGDAAAWGLPVVEQTSVVDAFTLTVRVSREVGAGFFADPDLGVAAGDAFAGWPVGSGAYRPGLDPPASATGFRLRGPAVIDARAPSQDARDALDAGLDLLITMDAAVIDYAEASPELETVPLTWDRTFVLLAPAGAAPPSAADAGGVPLLRGAPGPALAALARDAVRVPARPAGALDARCVAPPSGAPLPSGARAPRIVYPEDDAVARSLAERLVALALGPARPEAAWLREILPDVAGGGERVSAAALDPADYQAALRDGRDAAYVLPVERTEGSDVACAVVAAAVDAAPWLRSTPSGPGAGRPAILPLVDARSTLVLRRGIAGLYLDGSGVLRLDRVRRIPAEQGP